MNTQTANPSVSRTFSAPVLAREYGVKSASLTVTATTGRDRFSVTCQLDSPQHRNDCLACGCMHEETAKYWPAIAPLIPLHLSDIQTGEPMHAEANGWYWLAGAAGGLGERYHRSNAGDHIAEQCFVVLASHLRISEEAARSLVEVVSSLYNVPVVEGDDPRASKVIARNFFHDYVNNQRARWQNEAALGMLLIRRLGGDV